MGLSFVYTQNKKYTKQEGRTAQSMTHLSLSSETLYHDDQPQDGGSRVDRCDYVQHSQVRTDSVLRNRG